MLQIIKLIIFFYVYFHELILFRSSLFCLFWTIITVFVYFAVNLGDVHWWKTKMRGHLGFCFVPTCALTMRYDLGLFWLLCVYAFYMCMDCWRLRVKNKSRIFFILWPIFTSWYFSLLFMVFYFLFWYALFCRNFQQLSFRSYIFNFLITFTFVSLSTLFILWGIIIITKIFWRFSIFFSIIVLIK